MLVLSADGVDFDISGSNDSLLLSVNSTQLRNRFNSHCGSVLAIPNV